MTAKGRSKVRPSGTSTSDIKNADGRSVDLIVIRPHNREWTCHLCGGTGWLLKMEDGGPVCLTCADLDELVYLPAGNTALTRRARKASRLSGVVIRFSRARERYEREGVLVEESALQEAEQKCLADEDLRAARRERDAERREQVDKVFVEIFAASILVTFPGCPRERAEAIARHTGERGSGRVGRSPAGQEREERAVTAAVVASIRHEDTEYDELLMTGVPRHEARERIRADVDRMLHEWTGGGTSNAADL